MQKKKTDGRQNKSTINRKIINEFKSSINTKTNTQTKYNGRKRNDKKDLSLNSLKLKF